MSPDEPRGDVPHPPYDELRVAAGDEPEHVAAIDALHRSLAADEPDRAAVESHVTRARSIPALEAQIAVWWESPATQRWVKALTDAGL